jgi:predicted dehydrogenase
MMSKLRAALLGTGNIARQHLRGLRAHKDQVDLVAVLDVDPVRAAGFAREHGIAEVHTDLTTLLAQVRPDIVHICTPPSFHAALAIACLEGGAHVLCEKPLCASLAELDLIQAAELRTGRFCATVFQMRYGSSGDHVRQVLRSGALGRPLAAVCNTLWYRSHNYYRVAWRGKWSTELGGPTVGHGIHLMDQMLYLLGDWTTLRAVARRLDRAIEVEDFSAAIVEFRNGCVATVINSVLSPREETYLRIDTQEATIELTHLYGYDNNSWRFTPAPGASADVQAQRVATPSTTVMAGDRGSAGSAFGQLTALPADLPANHEAQIGAVLNDVRAGTLPRTAGIEARNTVELLTSIYKSSFTGLPVEQGSITEGDPFYASFHGSHAIGLWTTKQLS